MIHAGERFTDHAQNPGFRDGGVITTEMYMMAKGDLLRFAAAERDTIATVQEIEALNDVLGQGQLARSFDAVIRAQAQGNLMPMLLAREHIGGTDDGIRRVQATVLDGGVAYSKVRFNDADPGGFIEEIVTLPMGPLGLERWRASTASAQIAGSWDESSWAAYYPSVDEGPVHSYMHYADDPSSYSGYAQCVQDMARGVLDILPLASFEVPA